MKREIKLNSKIYHNQTTNIAILVLLLFLPAIFGCSSGLSSTPDAAGKLSEPSMQSPHSADDFLVVDCLLPGQIRKLGKIIYHTPRRPIKTTAIDCEIRGGEYVAYDRSNYATALKVWMSQATDGDKVAQTYVGEIYEKGLGLAPQYDLAAEWYRKAAEQGYARAQINLGYLYEKGLGVENNMEKAIYWYRRASGAEALPIPDTHQKPDKEQELNDQIQHKKKEVDNLRQHTDNAQENLATQKESETKILEKDNQIADLLKKIASLESEKAALLRNRGCGSGYTLPSMKSGRYYALVIGNNKYKHFSPLRTAVNDARKIGEIISEKYGFRTKILTDANRYQIMSALNEFREKLTEKDNFLLFYAGHGEVEPQNLEGYWLPVDAEKNNSANWISDSTITGMLNIISARHVLVIADSCYAGIMTFDSIAGLETGFQDEVQFQWLKKLYQKRSRTVFTSGSNQPVLDTGGGKHSIFAKFLINFLETNHDFIEGRRLYCEVSPRVSYASKALAKDQEPQYASFKGHEGSDFFFSPVELAGKADLKDPVDGRYAFYKRRPRPLF